MASTRVSITIRCDEAKDSDGQFASLFSNGKAQLPVSVYVNVSKKATIAEIPKIGIVLMKIATNLNPEHLEKEYPMYENMAVRRTTSQSERNYLSHPENVLRQFTDGSMCWKWKCLITSTCPSVSPGCPVPIQLMAYARVTGLEVRRGDNPQNLTIFSVMDAEVESGQGSLNQDGINSSPVSLFSNNFITIEQKWKANIRIRSDFSPLPLMNHLRKQTLSKRVIDGGVYRFYAGYRRLTRASCFPLPIA